MAIEYEATFLNIDKEDVRKRLKKAGAKIVKSEFLQKRIAFHLPKENEIKGGWIRIRDEGDKTTLSLKIIDGNKIEDQKEICLEIDNFEDALSFLEAIGCRRKAYQESKRELWFLDNVEITIDEWPFLEPFVEVEGDSEEQVKSVSKKLGFNYNNALFCSVDTLYNMKYGISEEIINDKTPEIIFNGKNPFV